MTNAADEPTVDCDTAAWWAAVDEDRLTVNRCGACGEATLYVRSFCPVCWSEDVRLEPASGQATLYTWSVVHQSAQSFAERTPYTAAVVELAEGPRLMTIIEDCAEGDLCAGLELQVAFRKTNGGQMIPVFRPAK